MLCILGKMSARQVQRVQGPLFRLETQVRSCLPLSCAEGTACKSPPDVGKTSQAYYFVDRTTFVLRLHEGPGYVLLTHTGLWTCSSPQGKPGEVCHLPGNPAGWRGRHEGFG